MSNKEDKTLAERIKAVQDETNIGADNRNPLTWHRIIMAVVIAITGLLLVFGVILNQLNEKEVIALNNQSVIKSEGSRVLPPGDYYIYRVFLDPMLRNHYVVASMKGGALVSVIPPDKTAEPENIIAITKYDSAAYVIRVNENGSWSFLPTSVLKGILEKNNVIPSDDVYKAKYHIEENSQQEKQMQQNIPNNTGTAANNAKAGQVQQGQ